MPGFDRKGPLGEGPATGGGFGLCNRFAQQSGLEKNDESRRGRGLGRGLRVGRGAGLGRRGRAAGRGRGRGLGRRQQADNKE